VDSNTEDVSPAVDSNLQLNDLPQISPESLTNDLPSPFNQTFDRRSDLHLSSAPSSDTLLTLSVSSSHDEGDKFLKQSSHGRSFLTMGTRSFSFDFIQDSSESPGKNHSSSNRNDQPSKQLMEEMELPHDWPAAPFQTLPLTPIHSSIDANLSCGHIFPPVPPPIILPLNCLTLDQLFPFSERCSDNELSVGLNELILNISTRTGEVNLLRSLRHRFPECLDPQLRDPSGLTPLHLAMMNQHLDLALYFLHDGTYVSVSDPAGNTPLHLATFLEDTPFLEAVMEADVCHLLDVNAQNSVGHTPLHIAAALGLTSGVRYLIEEVGANPAIVDHKGMNPFKLANGNQHSATADYLFQFTPPSPPPSPQDMEVEIHEIDDSTPHESEIESSEQPVLPLVRISLGRGGEVGEEIPSSSTPLVIKEEITVPESSNSSSEIGSSKSVPIRTKWIIPKSQSFDSTRKVASFKVDDFSSKSQQQLIEKVDPMVVVDEDLDEFITSFYINHPEYKPPSSKDTSSLDSNIITGRTPPPPTLATENEIAVWKFLGRAILEANAMEEETKQIMKLSCQQLKMNPQVALAFDMKAFTMLGALTRSYAKRLFHRVAQAFFIWKFLGITIPSFSHPIIFAKHGYSLTSPTLSTSSELKQSSHHDHHHPIDLSLPPPPPNAPLSSVSVSSSIDLSNPALVFALKILARYVSRCKHESELLMLAMSWELWKHLPAHKPNLKTSRSKKLITPRSQSLPSPSPTQQHQQGSVVATSIFSTPQTSSSFSSSSSHHRSQHQKSLSTVKPKTKVLDSNSHVTTTPNQPTRKIPKSEGRRPESSPAVPEVEEDDLTALGALPMEITHLLKLNEVCLLLIIPSSSLPHILPPSSSMSSGISSAVMFRIVSLYLAIKLTTKRNIPRDS
jgi:hypothetical protein